MGWAHTDGCENGSAPDPAPIRAIVPDTPSDKPEVAVKTFEFPEKVQEKIGPGLHVRRQPMGSLSGKLMYIGAGHGWTADVAGVYGAAVRWYTQRGINNGMVEDYGNQDQMAIFAQYLWNAGATVIPTRPIGPQRNEVVLDQDDTTAGPSGQVTYFGSWSTSSGSPYYSKAPDTENYRFATASTVGPFPIAEYRPNIPAAGVYPVYTWALNSSNRANTLYRVHHAGGVTEVRVNHRMVGKGWVWLGSYYFNSGTSGYVEISGEKLAGDPGTVVIADAIRFGNGMGDIERVAGEGVSGFPRELEASRYWAQRGIGTGSSSSIYDGSSNDQDDNVGTPPRWAANMNDSSQGVFKDRLYISFHTNAGGGRGCVGLWNEDALFPGTMTPNQFELALYTGREVNEDMRQLDTIYFPTYTQWSNTTTHTFRRTDFAFGEIRNDTINGEMDATIVEVAFHDDAGDTAYMKDARGRRYCARATYQGIIRFYNNVHSESFTILPDEPENLRALNATDGSNDIVLTWSAPTAQTSNSANTPGNIGGANPTDYAVYTSTNGLDFSYFGSVGSTATTYRITGYPLGTNMFAQVTGVNAGGESLPSNVAGARVNGGTRPPALIVDGFDRYDNSITPNDAVSGSIYNISGNVARVLPALINDFSYVTQMGRSIGGGTVVWSFDSCTNEAIVANVVNYSDYGSVFTIFGRESNADVTFSTSEQTKAETHIASGKNLFVSGTEVGWDLGRTAASAGNKSFLQNTLRAAQFTTGNPEDNANTYTVTGAAGGIFSAIPNFTFDNGTNGTYDAKFPDILNPTGGSVKVLSYVGGAQPNSSAGISYDGTGSGRGKVVFLGFPFETIVSSSVRDSVMDQTQVFFTPSRLDEWMIF